MVDVLISPSGPRAMSAAESLGDLLRDEPELAGRVHLRRGSIEANDMGGAWDALAIAVGSSGALTVLAASLRAWVAQPRWKEIDLSIEVSGRGAKSVKLSAHDVRGADLERLLGDAMELSNDSDASA